jgi:hypothetical protein
MLEAALAAPKPTAVVRPRKHLGLGRCVFRVRAGKAVTRHQFAGVVNLIPRDNPGGIWVHSQRILVESTGHCGVDYQVQHFCSEPKMGVLAAQIERFSR